MAYQVTIRTAVEREQLRKEMQRNGVEPGNAATYVPAHRVEGFFGGRDVAAQLHIAFTRPEGNVVTQSEWVGLLAAAVQGCKRKGQEGRGLSREEFLELVSRSQKQDANVSENGWSIPMARGCRRGIKAAELKALRARLGW